MGRWVWPRHHLQGGLGTENGGGAAQPLLSILPGGPSTNQIANPAGLTDSKGNAVTCTRASTKYCRKSTTFDPSNLLAWTENLSVAATWTVQASGAPQNPVATGNDSGMMAPDGTQSATKIVYPVVSAIQYSLLREDVTVPATGNYTFSIWLYSAAATTVYISANFLAYTACSIPAGVWTRFSDTRNITVGPNGHADVGFNSSPGGTAGTTIWAWGAKYEAGSSATTYVSPMLVSMANNVPSVEPEGLRVEAAATNNVLQSQTFDNAYWTKIASASVPVVTADQMIAPDGTLTADKVVYSAQAISNYSLLRSGSVTCTAVPWTASAYVYCASAITIYVSANSGTNYTANAVPANTWTRISDTRTLTAAGYSMDIGWNVAGITPPAVTVYVWGAQMELGSWATSYVATVAATAARAVDNVSVPNPFQTADVQYGMAADVQPLSTWVTGANRVLAEAGAGLGNPNTVSWFLNSADQVCLDAEDGAAGDLSGAAVGPGGSARHRIIVAKTSATTATYSLDGAAQAFTVGGSAAPTTQPATLYLGGTNGATVFTGWLSNMQWSNRPSTLK